MAVSDGNRSRVRPALAAVLTALILVPAGILFVSDWGRKSDDRDSTALEQKGVDYLGGLLPLVSALTEAQSTALRGNKDAPASLTAAVAQLGSIDQRLGADLRTTQRWTTLRDSIGRLSTVSGEKAATLQAHIEVSTLALALALADTVAGNSELARDPDSDVSHLREALAVDLPQTVVQVSRTGDLSQLIAAAKGNASQQALLLPQFGAAVSGTNAGVVNLTDDLQTAVDNTDSSTLSGSLVTTLDGFRRSVEALTRGADPAATLTGNGAPNAAALASAQKQVQNSLTGLTGVLVREMKNLLDTRADSLDTGRILTAAMAALIILLVIGAVILALGGSDRRRPARPRDTSIPPMTDAHDPYAQSPHAPASAHAEVGPNRQERSGALR